MEICSFFSPCGVSIVQMKFVWSGLSVQDLQCSGLTAVVCLCLTSFCVFVVCLGRCCGLLDYKTFS